MNQQVEERAKAMLRSALESALGPKLPGVAGYGVGLDHRTHELGLNVRVNQPRAASRLKRTLPTEICDLPVRVSVIGAGRLD